jgi:hypothetical protein
MDRFQIIRVGRKKQGARDNPDRMYSILDAKEGKVLITGIQTYEDALALRKHIKKNIVQELDADRIKAIQESYNNDGHFQKAKQTPIETDFLINEVLQALQTQTEPLDPEQLESLKNLMIDPSYYKHLLVCKTCPDQASIQCDTCQSWFCSTHLEAGLFQTLCDSCRLDQDS